MSATVTISNTKVRKCLIIVLDGCWEVNAMTLVLTTPLLCLERDTVLSSLAQELRFCRRVLNLAWEGVLLLPAVLSRANMLVSSEQRRDSIAKRN